MFKVKVIDRYIFRELLGPYIFGMLGFIVVISIDPMIYAMKNVITSDNRNVDPFAVLKWFTYSLATDMIFTFPMAMLLATLLVFGRFSNDSELVALRAGGVSFFRLCYPVMAFAVISTLVAFLFGEFVSPYAVSRSQQIKRTEILKLLPIMGQENVYIKDSPDRTIYVERVDNVNNILTNVIISEYDHKTDLLKRRVFAKTGRFSSNKWLFQDGVIYDYDDKFNAKLVCNFSARDLAIEQKPTDFKRDEETYQELSMRRLKQKISYAYEHGLADVTGLLVEFYVKTSIPFACFIFGIIGATLGTSNSRSGAFIGFGISIVIIFIYYVIFSISRSLGKNGTISPLLAAWLQNIIFLVAAFFLAMRVKN